VQPVGFVGPAVLIVGEIDQNQQRQVLRLLAKHGKCEGDTIRAVAMRGGRILDQWQLDRLQAELS
jgi:hypothetical protein